MENPTRHGRPSPLAPLQRGLAHHFHKHQHSHLHSRPYVCVTESVKLPRWPPAPPQRRPSPSGSQSNSRLKTRSFAQGGEKMVCAGPCGVRACWLASWDAPTGFACQQFPARSQSGGGGGPQQFADVQLLHVCSVRSIMIMVLMMMLTRSWLGQKECVAMLAPNWFPATSRDPHPPAGTLIVQTLWRKLQL